MARKTYINTPDVVKLTGMSRSEVIQLVKDGVIHGHQTKRGWWRYDKEDVERYLGKLSTSYRQTVNDNKFDEEGLSPYSLAAQIIEKSSRSLLIVGKAGTGKTTFLKELVSHTKKRISVVAPSGIASLEAGGQTIHSFFGFNTLPYVPGGSDGRMSLSRDELLWIAKLDTLVIDEISMVRADLLDHIDSRLRRIRHIEKPFGGVQIVMIGDLKQIPPVVEGKEAEVVYKHYYSAYFFASSVLAKLEYLFIEFNRVFRQTDKSFVDLLNRVRDNKISNADILKLNSRYKKQQDPGAIQLTTHKKQAYAINNKRLDALSGKEFVFTGIIEGNYPKYDLPADEPLKLKKGAKVMFVRNSPEEGYVNGTLGSVKSVSKDAITVLTEEGKLISLKKWRWYNEVPAINPETQEVYAKVLGTYDQYPLILAWAITIHKSQGQTFDKAVVDLRKCFAEGQAYVALSRCRSIKGLTLSSQITRKAIITDPDVDEYLEKMTKKWPLEKIIKILSTTEERTEDKVFYDAQSVYEQLDAFRLREARRLECTRDRVLKKNALRKLAFRAPKTIEELVSIPEIDQATVKKFGTRLLRIVSNGFKKKNG